MVEQALRISQPSYSLKKVEAFYMPTREAPVTDGEDSILKFEEWLDSGDPSLLDWIRDYNAEDCRSTLLLRDWLLKRRAECEAQYVVEIAWRPPGEEKPTDAQLEANDEVVALQERLLDGVPDDRQLRSDDEQAHWLLAQLIDYHRRDEKPFWWEFFSRFEKSEEELETRDSEALSGLSPVDEPTALPKPSRSLIYTLSYPPQEHKISAGSFADPFTARSNPQTGELDPFTALEYNVERILDAEGIVEIRRSTAKSGEPLPRALIPSTYYNPKLQRTAIRELAGLVIDAGLSGAPRHGAALAILKRSYPQTDAVAYGEPLQAGAAEPRPYNEARSGVARELPLHPRPTRIGEDLHRRPADPQPPRPRPQGRGVGEQPQGDP